MFVSVFLLLYGNRYFRCFDWTETIRRTTETVSYGVHFGIFSGNLGFFRFFCFFVCFEIVCFGCFASETESFDVLIEQTEYQPKQFDREHIWVFLWKFRVVSVCFSLFRNSSDCFDIGSKHRNKPKFLVFGFIKQTETYLVSVCFGSNQNVFLFVSRTP